MTSLEDVRLLRLARVYEDAYERLALEAATALVDDEPTRRLLLRLAEPSRDQRDRLRAALDDAQLRMDPLDREGLARAALLDVLDAERGARDFYERCAERARDHGLARTFRELAEEEGRHVRLAEEALTLAERNSLGAASAVVERAARLRLAGERDELLLREGVSDFGG